MTNLCSCGSYLTQCHTFRMTHRDCDGNENPHIARRLDKYLFFVRRALGHSARVSHRKKIRTIADDRLIAESTFRRIAVRAVVYSSMDKVLPDVLTTIIASYC